MTSAEWLASNDPEAMLHCLAAQSVPGHADGLLSPPSDRKLRLFACACTRHVWHLLLKNSSREAVEAAERFAEDEAAEPMLKKYRMMALSWLHREEVNRTVTDEQRHAAKMAVDCCSEKAPSAARDVACGYKRTMKPRRAAQAAQLRDVLGNPFDPVRLPKQTYLVPLAELGRMRFPTATTDDSHLKAYLATSTWLTPDVLRLAQVAYAENASTKHPGALDPANLTILADALEDAGCDSDALLRHLRGEEVCTHCMLPTPEEAEYGGGNYWCPGCGGTEERGHGNEGWMPLRSPHYRGCFALDLVLGRG